jgi:hypothetical protein
MRLHQDEFSGQVSVRQELPVASETPEAQGTATQDHRGARTSVFPVPLQTGANPKEIFSVRRNSRSGTGLVQQTVQIAARFARTI